MNVPEKKIFSRHRGGLFFDSREHHRIGALEWHAASWYHPESTLLDPFRPLRRAARASRVAGGARTRRATDTHRAGVGVSHNTGFRARLSEGPLWCSRSAGLAHPPFTLKHQPRVLLGVQASPYVPLSRLLLEPSVTRLRSVYTLTRLSKVATKSSLEVK